MVIGCQIRGRPASVAAVRGAGNDREHAAMSDVRHRTAAGCRFGPTIAEIERGGNPAGLPPRLGVYKRRPARRYSVGGTSTLSMMCTVALPTVMFEHTTWALPPLMLSEPSASTENV